MQIDLKLFNENCIDVMDRLHDDNVLVNAIVTDPPYYIIPKGKLNDKFDWDNFESLDQFIQFTKIWFSKAYDLLNDNSFMFIFWSQKYLNLGFEIFNPSRLLVWNYENLVIGGNGNFAYNYEPIFVVKKGNPKLIPGKHSCILKYTKPQSNFVNDKLLHPTQKPIALIEHLISITNAENVLDPFMGSGTTGVACITCNRNFIGCEIEKKCFEIAKQRIESKQWMII